MELSLPSNAVMKGGLVAYLDSSTSKSAAPGSDELDGNDKSFLILPRPGIRLSGRPIPVPLVIIHRGTILLHLDLIGRAEHSYNVHVDDANSANVEFCIRLMNFFVLEAYTIFFEKKVPQSPRSSTYGQLRLP